MRIKLHLPGTAMVMMLVVASGITLFSSRAWAQQTYKQSILKSRPPEVVEAQRPIVDSGKFSFMNKIRGGMQIRPQRAIFSLTNSCMIRFTPSIDAGITSGVEYYDVLGGAASMIQVPLMLTLHVYLSKSSYFVFEPMYTIPFSADHVTAQNLTVDYPRARYRNTFGGGFGYGHWLTGSTAFEIYMRGNRFGLEGTDTNTPLFVGVNLAWYIN